MRVLSESWCFCNGGGKSERLKATIFSTKSAAMAKVSASSSSSISASASGTGFLIHWNLLLTSHVNLPSVSAAESAEIRLQNGVLATLVPHRFFITSSVLDLTIVGVDTIEGDPISQGQQLLHLKLCSKPNLELGSIVYLLGHAEKEELTMGEGKVVIATDNLIKLSTEGLTWTPGSAGFDLQGNLAFMVCDPMKLATSPNTKSTSTSSSPSPSWNKNLPMQFGIPMPVIFDWLNQHWEGNLDDLSKPKLPLMRLVSSGRKTEHSCASFTMRQVFKATDSERTSCASNTVSKHKEQPGQGYSVGTQKSKEEKVSLEPHAITHTPGIPTPEIYESPKLTANPVKKATTQIQLLDMNFSPRLSIAAAAPVTRSSKKLLPHLGENCVNEAPSHRLQKNGKLVHTQTKKEKRVENRETSIDVLNEEAASIGSVGDAHSVQSSSSSVAVPGVRDDLSSEGETLYSAETAESRNYTSPREGKFQPVGRSQSCVSYNRWGPVHRNPMARKLSLEKHRNFMQPGKTGSQGAPSHKTIDYFSPTVSSIMKKCKNIEQPTWSQPTAVRSSLRWNF